MDLMLLCNIFALLHPPFLVRPLCQPPLPPSFFLKMDNTPTPPNSPPLAPVLSKKKKKNLHLVPVCCFGAAPSSPAASRGRPSRSALTDEVSRARGRAESQNVYYAKRWEVGRRRGEEQNVNQSNQRKSCARSGDACCMCCLYRVRAGRHRQYYTFIKVSYRQAIHDNLSRLVCVCGSVAFLLSVHSGQPIAAPSSAELETLPEWW